MKDEIWPVEDLEAVPNCPICFGAERTLLYADSTDRVFDAAPGKWSLYLCSTCFSAWLDPRPSQQSIGRAYESYPTHMADDDVSTQSKSKVVRQLHAWINDYKNARYGSKRSSVGLGGRWIVPLLPSIRAKANAECRHLPKLPKLGGRLLDVGFGNGGFLKIASEIGWDAEGIDFDAKAVEVASAQGLNVRRASVDELLHQNTLYDVITISHVIEHVSDPNVLLKNLHRLLKPGGFLWLETPNIQSLNSIKFGPDWVNLDPPRHLVLFNPVSLRESLAKAGFVALFQRWHGMVSLSSYTASETIASGLSAKNTIPKLLPNSVALINELREIFQPSAREFLTFLAYKSP